MTANELKLTNELLGAKVTIVFQNQVEEGTITKVLTGEQRICVETPCTDWWLNWHSPYIKNIELKKE